MVSGALTPEVQEATIASRYVKSGSESHNADRIEFAVDNEELARQALEEARLSDDKSGFSVLGGRVVLIDFTDGHPANDPNFDEKLKKLIENLKEKGVKHGKPQRRPIQSEYLDKYDRRRTLGRIAEDALPRGQGGASLRDILAIAEKRNEEFIRERTESEEQGGSDTGDHGEVGKDEGGSGSNAGGAVLKENKSADTQDCRRACKPD